MLFIAKTPYGGPEADFSFTTMLLKTLMCVKKAIGNEIEVIMMDQFKSEFVREAYDPDISRIGDGGPLVMYIKDGLVYHLKQGNHDIFKLIRMFENPEEVAVNTEPVPYPVNRLTIYWEYIKVEAAYDNKVFGRIVKLIKKWNPESPLYWKIILPYFIDKRIYNAKASGRQIIFFFWMPLISIILSILYLLFRMVRNFLCKRQTIASRYQPKQ